MARTHRDRWHRKDPTEYTVRCKPIGRMIREAGLRYIDLFSLDVEGAELAVLKTMDWSIPVCIWVIELDGQNTRKDAAVRKLLESKGYNKSSWNINYFCQGL